MLASAAPADSGPPKVFPPPLYERPWLWLFMVIFYCSKWQNPFVWAETAFLIAANWSWDKRRLRGRLNVQILTRLWCRAASIYDIIRKKASVFLGGGDAEVSAATFSSHVGRRFKEHVRK